MSSRTMVIFGSGPGIGNHVASAFASHGFDHIILLARNAERLSSDASFVAATNPTAKITTIPLDLSDLPSITVALKKIENLAPQIHVVFFNAAVIQPTETALSVDVSVIETDFKVTNLALYVIAQWAIPKLQAIAKSSSMKPSFFVTNSHLPHSPIPQLLSLSLVKAAQKNMVTSFSLAYSNTGVHFGLIAVSGIVSPDAKVLNPKTIAERTWKFYEEGTGLEIVLQEE